MDIKFDQLTYDISLVVDGENRVDIDVIDKPVDILMQRLFMRLKTYPRDLFWNVNYGIDYLNDVFGKNKPKNSVDVILRNEILKEPMVKNIMIFESQVRDYNYACRFSVKLRAENTVSTYYVLTNEDGIILTNESGDVLTSKL